MKLLLIAALFLTYQGSVFVDKGPKSIKLPKTVKQNFVAVPHGVAHIDGEELTIEKFYLATQEVSNIYYQEYLAHLQRTNAVEEMEIAEIQTDNWLIKSSLLAPFQEHYLKHPAYNEYPVVNISSRAAEGYCKWLENVYNQQMDPGYHVELRLPTRAEWIHAAQNGKFHSYAWGGEYLRNSEGQILCNFRNIGAESISANPESGALEVRDNVKVVQDNIVITAPCKSFYPNELGLYNMNGNVAEMVSDQNVAVGGSWNSPGYDVRNESTMLFDSPSPFVGFWPLLKVVKD